MWWILGRVGTVSNLTGLVTYQACELGYCQFRRASETGPGRTHHS